MRRLPADLLERSPEESARLLALAHLREAESAYARLENPQDAEALHDFRVAIRRLRSCCRAYRPFLQSSVSRKLRRRLRALTETTNSGRDAEVLEGWVRAERDRFDSAAQEGVDWLLSRLEQRRVLARSGLGRAVGEEFPLLAETLRRRLSEFETVIHLNGKARRPSFGRVTGELVQAHLAELRDGLAAVPGRDGAAEIHRARISAKRLRYLLEPLARHSRVARQCVQRLKDFQSVTGDLRDTQVLAEEVLEAVEEAAAGRARRLHRQALAGEKGSGTPQTVDERDQSVGLLQVARGARERGDALYQQMEAEWLGGKAESFLARVASFGRSLSRRRRAPVEIERKFLLSALPERVRDQPGAEVVQGWLPGETLRERVRRTSDGATDHFTRTVKLGEGVRRTELEEETTREVFDALWPLTEGFRVEKRRYRVRENDLVWEVDEFTDRELVLAEVELRSEKTTVDLPDWLKPYVVREVTGEPEYVNLNLAK